MKTKYESLIKNGTRCLTAIPPHIKKLACKWVFKVKENLYGSIKKYKSILVAKGYHQHHGFDFHETFSPIIKPTTIRVILILALIQKWEIQQVDINNAFINGNLQEKVYMQQPWYAN